MQGVLISNPIASRVTPASQRVAERALEATFDLDVVHTEDRGHAAAIARDAAAHGAKVVVVHGGDGTVNEVVNGLLGSSASTEVTLGLLPGGGTNVLCRTLGYPRDLLEATDHLLALAERAAVRRINVGRLQTGRAFTFSAGLVLDAGAVRRVDRSGLRSRYGDVGYLYCVLREFFALRRFQRPPLVVHTPGGPVDAWWAIVSKSDPLTYFGSRAIHVAPRARHDLGLDVSAGGSRTMTRTMRWAAGAFGSGGQAGTRDYLYLHDLDECAVDAREPVPCQADGEFLGEVTSLRSSIVREALPVYA